MKSITGIVLLLLSVFVSGPTPDKQQPTTTRSSETVKRDARAKGLFYRPANDEPDGTKMLAMRHRIVAVRDGKVGLVPESFTFLSGDRMRLQVAVNRTGYMYILHRGSKGDWHLLFPDPRIDGGKHSAKAGQALEIPRNGWFEFDADPGVEELYIFFAVQPIRELKVPSPTETRTEVEINFATAIVERLVRRHEDQLRTGRTKGIYWTEDIKPDQQSRPSGEDKTSPATYTASIIKVDDGVVFRKIALRHAHR